MKKIILIAVLIFIAVAIYTWTRFYKLTPTESPQTTPMQDLDTRVLTPTTTISVNGQTYKVQEAKTETEKSLGLSGIKNIEPTEGMLFYFNPPRTPNFWMKDMLFAIDIYWLYQGQVIGVEKAVAPEPGVPLNKLKTYSPPGLVDQVLEVRAK